MTSTISDADLQALRTGPLAVGTRQVLRGIKNGSLARIFVANDIDTFLFSRITEAAETAGVPVTRVPTMKELGHACGVDVAAAAAGILR